MKYTICLLVHFFICASFAQSGEYGLSFCQGVENRKTFSIGDANKFYSIQDALKTPSAVQHLEIRITPRAMDDENVDLSTFSNLISLKIVFGENNPSLAQDWINQLKGTELYYLSTCSMFDLSGLNNLEALDIDNRLTHSISPTIGSLTQLKSLTLSDDSINNLPSSIFELENLLCLSLFTPQLNVLNENWNDLSHLKSIDVHSNELRKLPASMFQIGELESIQLNCPSLTSFPIIQNTTNLSSIEIISENTTNLSSLLCNSPRIGGLLLRTKSLNILWNCFDDLKDLQTLIVYSASLSKSDKREFRKLRKSMSKNNQSLEMILKNI